MRFLFSYTCGALLQGEEVGRKGAGAQACSSDEDESEEEAAEEDEGASAGEEDPFLPAWRTTPFDDPFFRYADVTMCISSFLSLTGSSFTLTAKSSS